MLIIPIGEIATDECWTVFGHACYCLPLPLRDSKCRPCPFPPSQKVMFIGTGEGKASLLPQLLKVAADGTLKSKGDSSPYPAARVAVGEGRNLAWCVDKAAASQCPPEIAALATNC